MNKWIGIGRLTQDPDIKHVESNGEQLTIATYTLAVNRKGKKDEADYIRCKAFGKTAEFVEQYLSKGLKMMVCGRIQTGSYETKEGKKVYTTDVIVEEHEFCEKKNDKTGNSEDERPSSEGFMDIPQDAIDDMPFKKRG